MNEWPQKTLGDLIHVKHGFAFKGEFFSTVGENLVLKPGNFPIGGGIRLRPGKDDYYTGTYPADFELSPGDLIVVMTDLTQAAPILGSPAFIPAEPLMLHNQRLGLVELKDGVEADLRFLYYLMLSDISRSQIRSTATGATVRHTAPERMYRVSIGVPPLSVQRAIGSVLGAIDDLIENERRLVRVIDELARTLYREWFGRFRYPGHEAASLVDSTIGPIPAGWEVENLFDAADVGFGYSFKSPRFAASGPFQIIRIRDILEGRSNTFTDEQAESRYAVVDDDVLIGMDGDFHMNLWTGGDAWLNQRVTRLRPKLGMSPLHLLLAIEEQITEWNRSIVGTTVAHLGKKHLERVRLAIPDGGVLAAARNVFDPMMGQRRSLIQSSRRLASMRDLLLPKLVSGEIDVSALDLDAVVEERVV
jgi:type I restriction enzyme S subunit